MVLNLVIETSRKPRYYFVLCCEIACCVDLMDSPFNIKFTFNGFRKNRVFNHVRQLEYNSNHNPAYARKYEVSNNRFDNTHQKHGQYNEHGEVGKLGSPKAYVVPKLVFLDFDIANLAGKVFQEVEIKHPKRVIQRVKEKRVDVLKAMNPISLLIIVHAHYRLNVDIIIIPINVRKAVVNHVVLHFPQMHITAHQIERITHDVVQPFVLRETAVSTVVHHVKTNSRQSYAEHGTEEQAQRDTRGEENNPRVQTYEQRNEDDRLQINFPIAPTLESIGFEIGIYTLFELVKERVLLGIE
jgi:hypothetical protein